MRNLSRRQFTNSVGASLLLSPILSMLDRKPAQAAAAGKAKRVLFFCTMGTNTSLWSPSGGETGFKMSDMLKPLEAVRDNLILIEGLPSSNPGDGHGSPEGLCARGNGYYAVNNVAQKKVSCDEFISQALIKSGISRPIPSLLLGADTSTGQTMLWKNDQAASIIASPASAYTTVFGNMTPASTGGGGSSGGKPDVLQARRKSILDTVMKELNDVKSIGGASEQAKLQAHIDSIRQLETKLTSSGMVGGALGGACNMAMKPTDGKGDGSGPANDVLHMDIIVNAFACDITRVAAIQFGTDMAFQVNLPGLTGDQHNGFLHGSQTDFTNLIKFEQWMATQFANLITTMKSRPAPDDMNKTLLDDTLIVWARDMGEAAVTHHMQSMRFVLAGGSGGYLKLASGGRYLNLTNASATGGANRHERVLLNCCEAMGVTSYAGFGDPNLATKTPLPNVAA